MQALRLHSVIEPRRSWLDLGLGEVWKHRELLLFLAWRDVMVRYKQTVLGAAWAVIQPVLTMIVFSVIFGRFAKLPSEGVPYPIFTFAALLPWQLFAFALSSTSKSLVESKSLVSKVYFPRMILPLASTLAGLMDFAISFLVLLGLMAYYKVRITGRLWVLPPLLILALFSAIGVGLWLSALNVKYRDVRYALPFLTQIWMYASPIAYSATLIPKKWQLLYALNPMAGVVEGFRWALLGTGEGLSSQVWVSTAIVILGLAFAVSYFARVEDQFADVI